MAPAGAPGVPQAGQAGPPAVGLEHAGIRLGGRYVWREVDLSVAPGEFVAVLGPNGSGKSTLLKTVLGVLPLTEGHVTVFGKRVRRGNDEIGYLPQRHSFDPDLRIRGVDLVRLGLDGARWGVSLPWVDRVTGGRSTGSSKRQRVREVVEMVGAGSYAGRSIGELSGGEQQRLLIAQALVTGARILILDEPLEGLDLSNQQAISGLIRDICREHQVTVLLVAHDVNPVLPHLNRVVYVAQGKVLSGKPEEVIRTETLSRLYGTSIEVVRTRDGRILVVGQPEAVSYHPGGIV
jgi:zinc/manganese transport system ATP-binding protein